jgi:hypothetical protein
MESKRAYETTAGLFEVPLTWSMCVLNFIVLHACWYLQDLYVTTKGRNKHEKVLLHGVSGVLAGGLTAVMGAQLTAACSCARVASATPEAAGLNNQNQKEH